ncbi:MAG: TIGR04282 family arsenosugar biosynthesis glycosyltransferase [Chitinophagaceae bacterium]
MKKAIIIFVRQPELGKVKTRLAKDIGEEAALQVYKNLLQHTHDIAMQSDYNRFVFYVDAVKEDDLWEPSSFIKRQQQGRDLGERMHLAFEAVFAAGYHQVVIIGSDCPGLTSALIDMSFEQLKIFDTVIGPANDGGYYLLGLSKPFSQLFFDKEWSTSSVLADAIAEIEAAGKSYQLLPSLQDIDTVADLENYKSMLLV